MNKSISNSNMSADSVISVSPRHVPADMATTSSALPRQRVIITGATSGLGRALAERFILAGWTVGAVGRNAEALEEIQASAPSRVSTMQIDVNDPEAPDRLDQLIAALGGMDIYLHCAGILSEQAVLDPSMEATVTMTNAVGFARMVSAAFNYFRHEHRENSRIVAISSVAGCRGLGDLPAYSASKAYDQAYLEALRQRADALHLPLRVVDIRPGWTRTPLLDPDRDYLFEMPASRVADMIFNAALHARRTATIGMVWQILTSLERILPAALWQRLHIPLWRKRRKGLR
ncbi:MAG: SDR family NAD(P)-dependent oxidoreductase [Muribaculaceae bacterium]|nr:SDR family NAD(P)-dependent oxidoreductase [Muribaculaceae bacterium]